MPPGNETASPPKTPFDDNLCEILAGAVGLFRTLPDARWDLVSVAMHAFWVASRESQKGAA